MCQFMLYNGADEKGLESKVTKQSRLWDSGTHRLKHVEVQYSPHAQWRPEHHWT